MEITERARVLRAIIMILLFNSISICKTERKMCFKTCQDISKSKNSQTDTVRFQKKKKKSRLAGLNLSAQADGIRYLVQFRWRLQRREIVKE